MADENQCRHFVLKFNEGNKWEEVSDVEVWCDGREYDPNSEGYRPRYSYKIIAEEWEYIDNDIFGRINEPPDLLSASRSLFAFLYACQEARPDSENYTLFPEHVRSWAHSLSEQISSEYSKLVDEMHNR